MSTHVVFLVHGMGDCKIGWSADAVKVLGDAYEKYSTLKQTSINKRFDFIEIEYNRIFEERREEWRKQGDVINKVLIANGLSRSAAARLLQLARAPGGDDNFFRTHILDVIMYRFLPQIADRIKRTVQEAILDKTSNDKQSEPVVWSIVGHSLGTAVVHDTLHAMFTHRVNDVRLHHTRKPEIVAMVANVSRVLWNDGSIYETAVYPHPDRTRGMCSMYLNFQHPLDPFPRVRQFHAPPSPWRNDENRTDYVCPRLAKDDITDWNVHDLCHYLLNPRVHVPLFRSLLWKNSIKKEEFDAAVRDYKKSRIKRSSSAIDVLEKFKIKETAVDDWEAITNAITGFRELVIDKGASS